jgi:hypothetical protein
MAGRSRLQKDAATITPAAKPVKAFSTLGCIFPFKKNTHAEPKAVPIKGISIPLIISAKKYQPP